MGRTRTNGRKSSKNKKNKTNKFSNDILGGILVLIGFILITFLNFDNIGFIANFTKYILKGLFGNTVLIFPVILIIIGIYAIMSDNKVRILNEIKRGLIVIVFLASFVYSIFGAEFNIFANAVKFLVDSFNLGISGQNFGGVIGASIASIFATLIGALSTQILFFFLTVIAIMYSLNISFKQFFQGVANLFKYIINMLSNVFTTLFPKEDSLENTETRSKRKERLAQEKKEKENSRKLNEKGSIDADKNLKVDKTEQVEFDFEKLGGKLTETQVQAKQQRDEFFKKQKEQKEDKDVKEVLTIGHTKHMEQDNYVFPSIEFLDKPQNAKVFDKKAIHSTAVKLQKTLASFGVEAKVTNITKGPTVTRYELTPSTGVKVSKIVNLSDDIALNLAAKSIRIEAPIPGKAAVGIEVPNSVLESVSLREVIESDTFNDNESKLSFSLGKDAAGELVVGDISKMPHVLVAGSTGSGKSVCINSMIISLLYKAKPSEVKLILIDPKMVELSGYNGIPHLLIPVVTDPKKAAGALNWAVQEMVNRYNLFASKGVKDIKGYNKIIEQEEEAKLPQIVIIIDELADLMMVAPNDVEDAICRLAQMARAAGMHLVIATQRPSVDVITGIIKANIPSRIAFTVSSQIDSRTILDGAGAEKLLGKGDMLYFPVGQAKPQRIQGAFISEKEIEKIVENIKLNTDVDSTYSEDIIKSIEKGNTKENLPGEDEESDPILNDAIDLVVDMGQASASMLQRRFKIGYSRAGRIVDQMEARGLISGYEGSKPRQVLVSKDEWQELKFGKQIKQEEIIQDDGSSKDEEE